MHLKYELRLIFVVNFFTCIAGLFVILKTNITANQLLCFLVAVNIGLVAKVLRQYWLFRKAFVSFFDRWKISKEETVRLFYEKFTLPLAENYIKKEELEKKYEDPDQGKLVSSLDLLMNKDTEVARIDVASTLMGLQILKEKIKIKEEVWFRCRNLIEERWPVIIHHFAFEINQQKVKKSQRSAE